MQCSSGWTSAKANTTRARSTATARGFTTNHLPQDETRLRELLTRLGEHGPVLVVVDQPASIGALAVAVARQAGIDVAYLPGLAMRRIADLHPGNAKTDAATRSSSPRLPGRCPTRCVESTSARRRWPTLK